MRELNKSNRLPFLCMPCALTLLFDEHSRIVDCAERHALTRGGEKRSEAEGGEGGGREPSCRDVTKCKVFPMASLLTFYMSII